MSDTLGQMLRNARLDAGMTLQDVARRVGCTNVYVHKLETGECRNPSAAVAVGLSEALGLPLATICRLAREAWRPL